MTQLAETLVTDGIVCVYASDGANNDEFGYSVAIDGGYMVVGSPRDGAGNGAIYIYELVSGTWTEVLKVAGSGTENFGEEVVISGDTIAASATEYNAGEGCVRVYVRTGGTWTLEQQLVDASPDGYENFGNCLALDGDILVAGSELGVNSASPWHRSGGVWTQKSFPASGVSGGDWYGSAVAVRGTTAVVGDPGDNTAATDDGSIYIFDYDSGAGTWSQTAKISDPDPGGGDYFGQAVALNNDGLFLAVVAPNDGDGGGNRGAIYVFENVAGTWTQRQKCYPVAQATSSQLGTTGTASTSMKASLTISNGVVYAGAPWYAPYGIVVVFSPDTDWSTGYSERALLPAPAEANAKYGWDVCCDGAKLVVGATYGAGLNYDTGSVFVIEPTFVAGGGDTTPPTVAESPAASTEIGPYDTLTIDVTDDVATRGVVLMARYASSDPPRATETVWNSALDEGAGAFLFPFLGSTRTAKTGGHTYDITRTRGWQSAPTIDVVAIDTAGNQA